MDMDAERDTELGALEQQINQLQKFTNAAFAGGTQVSEALAQLLRELERVGTLDRQATDRVRQCLTEPSFPPMTA